MTESPVVSRTSRRFEIVSPADFSLGSGREIAVLPQEATPYCVDFERQCLLCVTTPDILDHPFLYQAQREQARTVIRIPYSELPEEDVTPALIFSPGRCGSTLLFRILKAIGLPCASEPDYFSQLAQAFARDKSRPAQTYRRFLRSASAILARRLGASRPVIKLRAHCNSSPLLITQAFSSAKVVFLLRERRDWAMSVKRVSPITSARTAVLVLKRALAALDRLAEHHDVRVCHYREFSRPQAGYFRALVSFLGHDRQVAAEVVQAAASRDSQEGTYLARSKVAEERIDPLFLEEFERLWEAERPAAIIERWSLAGHV